MSRERIEDVLSKFLQISPVCMEEDCECCECDARRNAARILSKPDVEAVRERAMENRITALRRLVLVMEACVDEAEVYHECLSRGWNYNDLKKESE